MKNLFSNKQIDRVVTSAALDKTESIKFKRMLLSLGSGLVDNQYKQSFVVGSYINSLGEKKKEWILDAINSAYRKSERRLERIETTGLLVGYFDVMVAGCAFPRPGELPGFTPGQKGLLIGAVALGATLIIASFAIARHFAKKAGIKASELQFWVSKAVFETRPSLKTAE